MAHSFAAPDQATANLLRLVAGFSGLADSQLSISVGGVDDVQFATDGVKAFGANTACMFLASQGSKAKELLGDTPEQQAKVRPLQWAMAGCGPALQAKCCRQSCRHSCRHCRSPCLRPSFCTSCCLPTLGISCDAHSNLIVL